MDCNHILEIHQPNIQDITSVFFFTRKYSIINRMPVFVSSNSFLKARCIVSFAAEALKKLMLMLSTTTKSRRKHTLRKHLSYSASVQVKTDKMTLMFKARHLPVLPSPVFIAFGSQCVTAAGVWSPACFKYPWLCGLTPDLYPYLWHLPCRLLHNSWCRKRQGQRGGIKCRLRAYLAYLGCCPSFSKSVSATICDTPTGGCGRVPSSLLPAYEDS